jgi:hypothetical protein
MSIESIIFLFSIGLIGTIIIFLITIIVYSKINKSNLVKQRTLEFQQKSYLKLPEKKSVSLIRYTTPQKVSVTQSITENRYKQVYSQNHFQNSNTRPTYKSFYVVYNSSNQSSKRN